ncbi:hypothetical protein IGI37_003045 [Enterococcus sp. AZ194]
MKTNNHIFTRKQLETIFNDVLEKTLGEVDKNHIFDRTKIHPKITGIAGDVVEQSILGYPADSFQEPDLIVDGEEVELKTTGIRKSKKKKGEFEAKEPMSITAVSPQKIVYEEFESSNFWHKLRKLLLVYYLYDSEVTVPAAGYADFSIKGFDFYEFDEENKEILKNDWHTVFNYIKDLQETFDNPEEHYPSISSKLRPELMLIDTAPKWPNRPRFRLKRSTVTTMVQQYFGKKFEQLDSKLDSFSDIDKLLQSFTNKYKGLKISELLEILKIPIKLGKNGDVSKSVGEQIVTRMFGAKSKKMSKIEIFSEIGLLAKTITQTSTGNRTEDTKLFSVNFEEWLRKDKSFEESTVFSEFSEPQFLFIVFEETSVGDKLLENRFIGFKRMVFDESFIDNDVKAVWEEVRNTVFEHRLKETVQLDKKGNPVINKNGTVSTSVNFPKSKYHRVFFRGTGADSNDKPIVLNGISMYRQHVWIKGSELVKMLNDRPFI